jgi:adenine-specific DNA-methyltransferase
VPLTTASEIIGAALALGAEKVKGVSDAELDLVATAVKVNARGLRNEIRAGRDPFGDAFCQMRSAEDRRPLGQTYTPAPVVEAMINWADDQGAAPARVIDPGTGSARYLVAAGRRWPKAQLIGADVDPLAALMARGHLAAAGFADRSVIALGDYRAMTPPLMDGRTLYLGNPPYVRHHQITPEWKAWLTTQAKRRGLKASALAGLHVHFFLATVRMGAPGDLGAFITAAEWLDTNYGSLVRELLLDGLGGTGVHVLEPEALPFADAAATGAITTFVLGSKPTSLKLRRVETVADLGRLDGGRLVSRKRLADAVRWSPLTRPTAKLPEGYVELGELCRVHRGTVTGANSVWVRSGTSSDLPEHVQHPAVTKAKELFTAGEELASAAQLRRVVDLPIDLDELEAADRKLVEKWLKRSDVKAARTGYIASARKAWWSVGMRTPAPILATYMARRPPAFVRNLADAGHINIAHGLYPRVALSVAQLDALARNLRSSVSLTQGRTYAGGLTKFEPREMERLPVPTPELLLTS